jgi:molybdate transport system substrate-binding protein
VRRALALAAVAVLLSACGGGGGDVTVFAAASLTDVFEELSDEARFNFAGSDELATQIREGGRADVFASASPRYTRALFREGLIERPRVFAVNRLVLIVPRPATEVGSVRDLERPGVRLVLGAPTVPVGEYARAALARLDLEGALDNVVSEEHDVKGVVAKVGLGEADAGIVYATDVRAVADDVRALPVPASAQQLVRYEIAVVRGAEHRDEAEEFVDLLVADRGRLALRRAGFGLP